MIGFKIALAIAGALASIVGGILYAKAQAANRRAERLLMRVQIARACETDLGRLLLAASQANLAAYKSCPSAATAVLTVGASNVLVSLALTGLPSTPEADRIRKSLAADHVAANALVARYIDADAAPSGKEPN